KPTGVSHHRLFSQHQSLQRHYQSVLAQLPGGKLGSTFPCAQTVEPVAELRRSHAAAKSFFPPAIPHHSSAADRSAIRSSPHTAAAQRRPTLLPNNWRGLRRSNCSKLRDQHTKPGG